MQGTEGLAVAHLTDTGLIRAHNDDSIVADAASGLFIVADGMGGYNAGDVASMIATRTIREAVQSALAQAARQGEPANAATCISAIQAAIDQAHRAILQAAVRDADCQGMGTTVALLLFHAEGAVLAHVGDSRIYRLRDRRFEPLTLDHSLLQEQVDRGVIGQDDARVSNNRNLVTRALGRDGQPRPDIREIDVRPGDVYLMCTDGLNDMVDDADIGLAVSELAANLPLASRLLVEMAKDNGGHDNISVVLVRVGLGRTEAPGIMRRLFGWLKAHSGIRH